MDKNLLRFYIVAFFFVVATMTYMQYLQRRDMQAREAEAGAYQLTNGTQVASGSTSSPLPPGETPKPSAIVAPHENAPAKESAPETKRPADLPLETVKTENYLVKFSPAGGVPAQWDIFDVHMKGKTTAAEQSEQKAEGDAGETAAVRAAHEGRIPLIDTGLEALGLDRPLEIVLKEDNAKYYNELNQKIYKVSREETPESLIIRFESPATESGVRLIKTYTFPRDPNQYEVTLTLELINGGSSNLSFNDRGQGLGITIGPGLGYAPGDDGGFSQSRYEYTSGMYKMSQGITATKPPKDGTPEKTVMPGGGIEWGALHNRYFMMAVVPEGAPKTTEAAKPAATPGQKLEGFTAIIATLDTRVTAAALATDKTLHFYPRVEMYGESFSLAAGASKTFTYMIFAGPKDRKALDAADHGLDQALFQGSFSLMRKLALLLMSLLSGFHALFHSWGLAIIGVVLTVRLVTFPIAQIGLKQQAKMMAEQAKIKPFMDKINEKYKDDPAKKNQEMMKLYREHNINPLGMFKGCLWMIIQLPVFYALYRLLSQSFDLRGASFLWIKDLSAPDHLFALPFAIPMLGSFFNLLPMLTSATQMILSKLSYNPNAISDPNQAAMQKQMTYFVPIMVFVMTYSFPSGLTLYWMISNIWQLFQQQFVNKKILKPPPRPSAAPA